MDHIRTKGRVLAAMALAGPREVSASVLVPFVVAATVEEPESETAAVDRVRAAVRTLLDEGTLKFGRHLRLQLREGEPPPARLCIECEKRPASGFLDRCASCAASGLGA